MNGDTGYWVGIDVAKTKLDAAFVDRRGKLRSRTFANNPRGHAELTAWLRDRLGSTAEVRVCMEATGPYGEAPAMALSDAGFVVSVVNPARVKGFAQGELARNKTDRADAALLARFGQAMQPEAWVPPPAELRELRALVDRLQSLKEMHQQESNRLEAAINQPSMRGSIEAHLQWLHASIKELERKIDDHIDRHPGLRDDVELITSIPGVGANTAMKMLAYLGDMRRFKNGKALAAFVGVTPALKLSGSSIRGRSTISRRGHAGIRHCLYMPAMVAIKHNPLVSVFGHRLKAAGLAPKAIIAACMHKLVLLVYGIVKSGIPFNPNFGPPRLDLQDGI